MRPFERAPFNNEVVAHLELLLERAKAGAMNFFAYAYAEGPIYGENAFLGDVQAFYNGYYGLHECATRVMEQLRTLNAPMENSSAPANMWAYDLSKEPISHDFIVWLVTVKMIQRAEGVEGPTHIAFCRSATPEQQGLVGIEARNNFTRNVMRPALALFDCVQDMEAAKGRRSRNYTFRDIVLRASAEQTVPKFTPNPEAMASVAANLREWRLENPVVITLREHDKWEHRNSGIPEWLRFGEYLEARGENVIFLRDTAFADAELEGFETFPAASKDLFIRTALYEQAKCNLFVSNGTSVWGQFGTRPWLMFVDCNEAEKYSQNTTHWWQMANGIAPPTGQWPWAGPQQRMVWAPDTFDNIVAAWEEMFPAAKAEAA